MSPLFQANLRMDKRVPQKDKQKKVEDLLTKLGLMKVADTLCGLPNGAIRAISGNIFLFTIPILFPFYQTGTPDDSVI